MPNGFLTFQPVGASMISGQRLPTSMYCITCIAPEALRRQSRGLTSRRCSAASSQLQLLYDAKMTVVVCHTVLHRCPGTALLLCLKLTFCSDSSLPLGRRSPNLSALISRKLTCRFCCSALLCVV